jgi:hypothetical protein
MENTKGIDALVLSLLHSQNRVLTIGACIMQ